MYVVNSLPVFPLNSLNSLKINLCIKRGRSIFKAIFSLEVAFEFSSQGISSHPLLLYLWGSLGEKSLSALEILKNSACSSKTVYFSSNITLYTTSGKIRHGGPPKRISGPSTVNLKI